MKKLKKLYIFATIIVISIASQIHPSQSQPSQSQPIINPSHLHHLGDTHRQLEPAHSPPAIPNAQAAYAHRGMIQSPQLQPQSFTSQQASWKDRLINTALDRVLPTSWQQPTGYPTPKAIATGAQTATTQTDHRHISPPHPASLPRRGTTYTSKYGTFVVNKEHFGSFPALMSPLPLGDAIDQATGKFERGVITGYIILVSYGVDIKHIDSIKHFASPLSLITNQKMEAKHENLPDDIQDVLNFDATLDRLAFVMEANEGNPFATEPIPGVRMLKVTALNTYQYMIDEIKAAPKGNQNAIAALIGFESILWKLYNAASSWYKSEDDALKQIRNEIKQLATVAQRHDAKLAKSMEYRASDPRWYHWIGKAPKVALTASLKTLGSYITATGEYLSPSYPKAK